MTPETVKRLAMEARIDKPYMDAAISAVRRDIIEALENTAPHDETEVRHHHARLVLLMDVVKSINNIIANGDHAAFVEGSPGQ